MRKLVRSCAPSILLLAGIAVGMACGAAFGWFLFWALLWGVGAALFGPIHIGSYGEFAILLLSWGLFSYLFMVIGLIRGIYLARWLTRRYLPATP